MTRPMRDEWYRRAARSVLLHELTSTVDHGRAARSRWVWRYEERPGSDAGRYVLSPLGLLNGLLRPLGLTLGVHFWSQLMDS